MKNERLASTFATSPYETRVLVSMVEAMLGPSKVEDVLNDLESPSLSPEIMIDGRPLRFWSGLSDAQLDAVGISPEGRAELKEYFDIDSPRRRTKKEEIAA